MSDKAFTRDDLREYYDSLNLDGSFVNLCKMNIPNGLSGRRVLDIACRTGKGVYKFSDAVGKNGFAHGVDWDEEHIRFAEEGIEAAIAKSGLEEPNMAFSLGYPEDLIGLEDGSFDFVYINSILNLVYDLPAALAEIKRVLRKGGVLWADTVVAKSERDPEVVEAARMLGNAIQAAPLKRDLIITFAAAGFTMIETSDSTVVLPSDSATPGVFAPMVETDEMVAFASTSFQVHK